MADTDKTTTSSARTVRKHFWLYAGGAFLTIALILRLVTISQLGLLDPSEGRYAVAAKDMVESTNWVTPVTHINGQIVPFLAKPPLYIWLSALCIKYLGVNELAARLPSFGAGLITCLCVGVFGFFFFGREAAGLAVLALSSSLLFFFLTGACILDPLLTTCTAICMASFPLIAERKLSAKWNIAIGYIFVFGLSLGVLTKGPLALVLTGFPILLWMFLTKNWGVLRRFPWRTGTILFACLVCPWFVLAEQENPGFLRYFIVNENFLRYLVRNYGDRYGTGHTHPYGYIWFSLLVAFLPWTPLSIVLIARNRCGLLKEANRWVLYLLICALFPPLFFTFARQVTINYVMPALPALSLLTSVFILREFQSPSNNWVRKYFNVNIWVSIALLALTCVIGMAFGIHWILSLFSLTLLLVLLGLVHKTESGKLQLIAQVSMLSTSVLFALGTINARPWLDANLSAKDLTSFLEANYEKEDQLEKYDFLFKIPHSFYFYSDGDEITNRITSGTIPLASNTSPIPIVIIKKSDLDRVKSPSLRIREQIGGYTIVENL